MSKRWMCCILLLCMIETTGCQSTKEMVAFSPKVIVETPNPTSAQEEIREEIYHKDGIEARYPGFVVGNIEEKREEWNEIIAADINKVLQIYSFNPFPELTPTPTGVEPVILRINYVIKSNNNEVVSIFYTAEFNSPYSAHPTDLVYTTNIDKTNNQRLKLKDIVKLNDDFVQNFREWNFISVEEGNEELNQAIRDYMSSISDEDLLLGFKTADQIGSENLWGIYSYLTSDRLGISVSVPNYIGDHVEFEREFNDLEEFLVPGFVYK